MILHFVTSLVVCNGSLVIGTLVVMMESSTPGERLRYLSQAFPGTAEEALEEAEATLDRYLRIVLRIHDRLCADPLAYAAFIELTAALKNAEMDQCKASSSPPTSRRDRLTQS